MDSKKKRASKAPRPRVGERRIVALGSGSALSVGNVRPLPTRGKGLSLPSAYSLITNSFGTA